MMKEERGTKMPHHRRISEAWGLVDGLALFESQTVFDGDWDWHIGYIKKYGSKGQKKEDIPYIQEMRQKYAGKDLSEYAPVFAQETKETRMKTVEDVKSGHCKDAIKAMEAILEKIIQLNENLAEREFIRSLKLLKDNIEFGTKKLDETAAFTKSLLLTGVWIDITRHEFALCLQHLIDSFEEITEESQSI